MTRINPANILILTIFATLGLISPKMMVLHPEELKNNIGKGDT